MKKRDEKGFTLIELMIVIAIIGILAAIAIPNFNAYRARSYNASANTDIRNLVTSQEGYFVDHDFYAGSVADLANYGYVPSDGVVTQSINVGPATGAVTYSISNVYNSKASDKAKSFSVTGPGGEITRY